MSDLKIYNTLTRQKEKFVPIDEGHVRMYVCGPTVYDFAHIGNARPVVVFDTLYRLLKRLHMRVTYVRNITDVDDKIMAKAKEKNVAIGEITSLTTHAYHDDMAALNALSPDIEPKATEHIDQMIDMIKTLIEKNHAYLAEGHVLFNVPSMKDYGALSRRSHDELIAGARVEVAPYKKDPSDFVIWKPSTPDQQGWDSPWGRGRPGWHIECSAMAAKHLGTTFDIHGGGLDLIFPHHENEIAQSRCAHNGAPLANYWMHNGFLTINSDKMSKSLGNVFTVRELLKTYPGEAIRLSLLTGHYRQPLDFSKESLEKAKSILDRFYSALRQNAHIKYEVQTVPSAFDAALLDDLNTPLALAELHELVNQLNRAQSDEEKSKLKSQLLLSGKALGILKEDPEIWFKKQPSGSEGFSESEIENHIKARLAARASKDYSGADRIRDALAAKGIILEDSNGGTTWRRG